MRIVQVGKFYFPQGGADKYFLDLSSQLVQRGHAVACFSLHHPKNEPSEWSPYFAPSVYFNNGSFWGKMNALLRRLVSGFESRRLFEKLVRDFRPDIIHVHNICHYLSPSFLWVARKYEIPVVMHLHDYSLISPNYLLHNEKGDYDGGKKERYFACVKDRCFKNSYIESFLVACEMFIQHRVLRIFEKCVTVYVAPSQCMVRQMIEWRPDIRNIQVIPHGIEVKPLAESNALSDSDQYFLYVGRLSLEKGVHTLIRAFCEVMHKNVKLKIVGEGPLREQLEALVKELHIESRVAFLGFKSSDDLKVLMERSLALVVPSEWKEVFGLVVIEGMERGKLVIGSRAGAIPEIIEDNRTGLLFDKGDTHDLCEKMQWVLDNPSTVREIGSRARAKVEEQLSYAEHIVRIENLYQDILDNKK